MMVNLEKKKSRDKLGGKFLSPVFHQFSPLILSDSVLSYLRSCIGAMPSVSHMSAWILHHEHHLLYLLLRLAHKLVTATSAFNKFAYIVCMFIHTQIIIVIILNNYLIYIKYIEYI